MAGALVLVTVTCTFSLSDNSAHCHFDPVTFHYTNHHQLMDLTFPRSQGSVKKVFMVAGGGRALDIAMFYRLFVGRLSP
jgi:hypothetical protein